MSEPTTLARRHPSTTALVVNAVFAIAGVGSELGEMFPVLTLSTWLTNAAASGLVFLLAVTPIAVVVRFARDHHGRGIWPRVVAPVIAAVALVALALLVLSNFDLLIGVEGPSPLVVVLPGIIIGSGVVDLIWGEILRHTRPDVYDAMSHVGQIPESQEIPVVPERA
ncbi:hypothetical protein KVA01_16340 [Kocuria varians]|uniref:Uncharacterized protein n=1 Tax=Kocuria varians TaxID=1272 RepID=A0A4Y4D672_KOCVA|nr:hypothetical protein [Kocuria varians]GEC99479.1 hypothetical protein KVA01_16340 [Kocuria varians]